MNNPPSPPLLDVIPLDIVHAEQSGLRIILTGIVHKIGFRKWVKTSCEVGISGRSKNRNAADAGRVIDIFWEGRNEHEKFAGY